MKWNQQFIIITVHRGKRADVVDVISRLKIGPWCVVYILWWVILKTSKIKREISYEKSFLISFTLQLQHCHKAVDFYGGCGSKKNCNNPNNHRCDNDTIVGVGMSIAFVKFYIILVTAVIRNISDCFSLGMWYLLTTSETKTHARQ